jgi:hypothetical protein
MANASTDLSRPRRARGLRERRRIAELADEALRGAGLTRVQGGAG